MREYLERFKLTPAIRGAMYFAVYWSAMAVYMPFMNLDLARRGFSGAEIGTIGSVRALVIFLAAPFFANLADRKRCRVRVLRLSTLISAFVLVLMMFPRQFPWLVGVMVLLSLANSPIDSLGNAITVRMSNRYRIDFGMMTFWGAVSFALANLIGGVVWQAAGFRWIYAASALFYLLVSFVASLLEEPSESAPEQPTEGLPASSPVAVAAKTKFRFSASTIVFLVAYFAFDFGVFVAYSFTAPYLDLLGANEFMIGLVGTTVGIGGMLARMNSQKIMRRLSIEAVMMTGLLLNVVAMAFYGLSSSAWLIIVFSTLRGAGWALFSLGTIKFIDNQASLERAGTLQSVVIMLSTLGGIIANPLAGALFDLNARMMYAVSSASLGVSLVILLTARRMRQKEAAKQPLPVPESAV